MEPKSSGRGEMRKGMRESIIYSKKKSSRPLSADLFQKKKEEEIGTTDEIKEKPHHVHR